MELGEGDQQHPKQRREPGLAASSGSSFWPRKRVDLFSMTKNRQPILTQATGCPATNSLLG